jgi:hypothetical protein
MRSARVAPHWGHTGQGAYPQRTGAERSSRCPTLATGSPAAVLAGRGHEGWGNGCLHNFGEEEYAGWMENNEGKVEPMNLKRLQFIWRRLTCRHANRTREGVYRPQGSAQRRERYSCPECQRVWSAAAPVPTRSNSTSTL